MNVALCRLASSRRNDVWSLCRACFVLATLSLSSPTPAASQVGGCTPSAAENLLNVVGPLTGSRPVWIVDGSSGRWRPGVVKTLFVLSRDVGGSLRLDGRRLDGPGVLAFQDGVDGVPTTVVTIPDPIRRSVTPGGTSAGDMKHYAFIPMYVIYPSPGCWELRAQFADREVRIVIQQKPAL